MMPNDRLGKVQPLVDKLIEIYNSVNTPGKNVVIDV